MVLVFFGGKIVCLGQFIWLSEFLFFPPLLYKWNLFLPLGLLLIPFPSSALYAGVLVSSCVDDTDVVLSYVSGGRVSLSILCGAILTNAHYISWFR